MIRRVQPQPRRPDRTKAPTTQGGSGTARTGPRRTRGRRPRPVLRLAFGPYPMPTLVDDQPIRMHIDRFLRTSGMSAQAFGRAVMNDPRFVFDVRAGREPRIATRYRIIRFIREQLQESHP